MATSFRPVPGQIAFVERDASGPVTGLVGQANPAGLEIDLGLKAAPVEQTEELVINICAPDALYRLRGKATPGRDRGLLLLSDIEELERIQRRTAPRIALRLGVSLATFDDPVAQIRSVTGFTVDIGVGGVQVQTLRPLPEGDPTTMFTLPDGTAIAARCQVLQTRVENDAYYSRLAFRDLPADAMTALNALVKANQHLVTG